MRPALSVLYTGLFSLMPKNVRQSAEVSGSATFSTPVTAELCSVAGLSAVLEPGVASANVAEDSDVTRKVRASKLADSVRSRRRISPRFWEGAGRGSVVFAPPLPFRVVSIPGCIT